MTPRESTSAQTEFSLDELGTTVPDGAELDLANELESIVENMRQRIVNDRRLSELLRTDDTFTSADTVERQAPEPFTQDTIIEPLIDELGYPYAPGETTDFAEEQGEWADYAVSLRDYPDIDSQRLLIEAEPINKELDQTEHGLGQVRGWLRYRPFAADFGIASDGLEWYLIKYNEDTHSFNEIKHIDLREIFIALFENLTTTRDPVEEVLTEEELDVLHDFIGTFHFSNFRVIASGVQAVIRQRQKEITEEFYDEYIEIVFGILDEDTDGRDTERCLVGDGITAPEGAKMEHRRLFAVDLMNRLIFIQFLEDTAIVNKTLLKDLQHAHETGQHLNDFYTTFIQPLIYNVFNKQKSQRPDKIKQRPEYQEIPYLNGGLFRATIPNEEEYTVTDSVLTDIVSLLERYEFSATGGPGELDPSVLGTVFEKTINYLAGDEGTQKELGAYYTPDDITRYCSEKTVNPSLLKRFKSVLKEEWGWRQGELDAYDDIYMLIDALSPNVDVVDSLLSEVDDFRVVDPACGSGHFLTSVLGEIIAVRQALYTKHDNSPRMYELKKQTVLNNLYGVEIVGSGVEITKLRLWLSIMSEMTSTDINDLEPGELALPNVAFNIRQGNSLLGYTETNRMRIDEEDSDYQQSMLEEWAAGSIERLVKERQQQVNQYKRLYGEDAHAIEADVQATDEEYNRKLNEKLVDDLRDAGVSFEYEWNEIGAPDLPTSALHKISIRFEDAIDSDEKDTLDKKFRDETGMRINHGGGGYVSISMNHGYIANTPEGRVQRIIDAVGENNISDIEVDRYLTLEDVEELEYLHWPLEFYNAFDSGGFDVVIGNPPYGIDMADAESALTEYHDENHSSMVFAKRSEELVKDGGQIAFVVPKALTYAHRWASSRRHLLNQNLDYVIDLRESFDGVKQEQIILMFTPSETDEDVVVGRREEHEENGNGFFEKEYQQTGFTEDCFALWVDDHNEDALAKLSGYDTFDDLDLVDATKGIDNFKSYLTGVTDDLLAYRGDDVGQFRFVQKSYLDPSILDRSDSHLAGHGEEKIVFQRILAHVTNPTDRIVIQCAIDYDGACVPDTSIHATSDEYSLEALCGLVNSSLFAWYAYNMIYNRAIRSMDLTPIYFGRLPAPPENDEDLLKTIEEKTAVIVEAKEGREQKVLNAYDELDEAVFQLYQLTEEEREIIREETPPHTETLCSW